MKITAVLLAAGKGTRMRSKLPKVLHPLAGRPLIWHSIQAIKDLTDEKPVVVVGHQSEEVQEMVGDTVQFILQEQIWSW